jgi:methylated-DNA-[protein]-cysteine S-methyltransferase
MTRSQNKSIQFYDIYKSPIGTLFLTYSGKFLSGISFKKPPGISFKKGVIPDRFIKEISMYFSGSNSKFSQKIKFLTGTEFERRIWSVLNEIPFGETRSYKWVAEKAGSASAVRAVGQALSKNPVPIVLPCHRVIESDGSIGGYSSGTDIKRRLLDMEYYSKLNKNPSDTKEQSN